MVQIFSQPLSEKSIDLLKEMHVLAQEPATEGTDLRTIRDARTALSAIIRNSAATPELRAAIPGLLVRSLQYAFYQPAIGFNNEIALCVTVLRTRGVSTQDFDAVKAELADACARDGISLESPARRAGR